VNTNKPSTPPVSLDQLLQRNDIWRGNQQIPDSRKALDTGYPDINNHLHHQGWPCACLVEICQPAPGHGDWLLLLPALQRQLQLNPHTHAVLLNPPAMPFSQHLLQAGVPLQQLLMVRTNNKMDFIACFTELSRAASCSLLMAWQPRQTLSYTELRKCQLAACDGEGLYVLFRPLQALQQSSPAPLRLITRLGKDTLQVSLFRQRGQMHSQQPIMLPLPEAWQSMPPHRLLGHQQTADAFDPLFTGYQPRQNILPLSVNKGAGKRIRLKRAY